MHSNSEDQCSQVQPDEISPEPLNQSKFSYSRDFLLSLSELEICKTLPSGFDPSILSDFEDFSHSITERQRIPGSLPLQSFRRSEYGSSPPTRGDTSHYSRGIHGRWDNRSDRDNDTQSDRDSDSGRHGSLSRRPWQNPEHDGLLGSGAFPRPSGHTAGALAPKVRGNGHYQLSRSNEPYHPPRPYKAVTHSRREANDSYNDETFGSVECSSEDRVEEERKRRASFELMRKEQTKAFQEKQKQVPDKNRGNFGMGITALLEDNEDITRISNKNNECVTLPTSHSDSTKGSFPAQTPSSRPLVPPGFTSTPMEKNIETKSPIHLPASVVGNVGIEDDLMRAKVIPVPNMTYNNQEEDQSRQTTDSREQQHENWDVHFPFTNEKEKNTVPFSVSEVSDNSVVNPSYKTPNLLEPFEDPGGGELIDFGMEKLTAHKVINTGGPDSSTSILEKLFGSALTVSGGGSSTSHKQHDAKKDDTWSPKPVRSSKFAHWFLDEENKPVDDLSSDKPRDLLSLIAGSEKGGTQSIEVFDDVANEHILPKFPLKSNELTTSATSVTVGTSETLYSSNKPDTASGVLTCEDLEQSILSEIEEHNSNPQHPVQSGSVPDAIGKQPKPDIDDRASQHLLSLLQKGTNLKDPVVFPDLSIRSSEELHVYEIGSDSGMLNISSKGNAENEDSGRSLTLETLFGTAFMKELQSVGVPVSVQRGSHGGTTITDAAEPHGFPIPVADDGFFPSTVGEFGLNRINREQNVLAMNRVRQSKFENFEGHWLGSNLQTGAVANLNAGGFDNKVDGAVEIHLPEEDSLITIGDPVKPTASTSNFMPSEGASKVELLSSDTPVEIAVKLAALNAVFNGERPMVPGPEGSPFLRSPYDPVEHDIPYRHFHAQPSSPQFHHPHINHGRPVLHPIDSHHARMNPQIKFMGSEGIVHQEPPLHHHFPVDMFRSPLQQTPSVPTRFDVPATHHSAPQQMQMAGHLPPPHLLQGLPRGGPLPPHSISHVPGYISDPNPMQGFPLTHRQAHYGGPGMPMPAPGLGGGGNHSEALERLIEMELRANSKHPLAADSRSHGMYSHELDMGFRYR